METGDLPLRPVGIDRYASARSDEPVVSISSGRSLLRSGKEAKVWPPWTADASPSGDAVKARRTPGQRTQLSPKKELAARNGQQKTFGRPLARDLLDRPQDLALRLRPAKPAGRWGRGFCPIARPLFWGAWTVDRLARTTHLARRVPPCSFFHDVKVSQSSLATESTYRCAESRETASDWQSRRPLRSKSTERKSGFASRFTKWKPRSFP